MNLKTIIFCPIFVILLLSVLKSKNLETKGRRIQGICQWVMPIIFVVVSIILTIHYNLLSYLF